MNRGKEKISESRKKVIYAILQLHRFNVSSFDGETRSGNITKKIKREQNLDLLKPHGLYGAGINSKLFSGENDPLKIIDNLVEAESKKNDLMDFNLDNLLYEKIPKIRISEQGWRKYVIKKLNKVVDIAKDKNVKSLKEAKIQLIDKELFVHEEYSNLKIVKDEFYKLIGKPEGIFDRTKIKLSNISDEELEKIIKSFHKEYLEIKKSLRNGQKKEFVNGMLLLTEKAKTRRLPGKIDLLFDITDQINSEKLLFVKLAQRCERYYDTAIARFCRRILPSLMLEQKLSRPEIRLFIIMNLDLQIFGHHIAQKETLIRNFILIPKYWENFVKVIIERKRSKNDLEQLEKKFKNYLKVMKSLILLFQSYETERKHKSRSRVKFPEYRDDLINDTEEKTISPETVDESEIQATVFNDILSEDYSTNKKGSENSSEERSIILDEHVDAKVFKIWDQYTKQVLKPKKHSDPAAARDRLPRIYREVEIRDYIDKALFEKIEKRIFKFMLDGYTQTEIATILKISQQAISKRIQIMRKKLGLKRYLLFR